MKYKNRGEKVLDECDTEFEGMETDDITCPLDGAINIDRKCLETLVKNNKKYYLRVRCSFEGDQKEIELKFCSEKKFK